MNASNHALAVYTKAEERFNNGAATKADEVILALWDETKDNARMIREMALKISYLETAQASSAADEECAALLLRCSTRADLQG